MGLKELKFKDFQKLPENQKQWLLRVTELSTEEKDFEDNINSMPIFYMIGDYVNKRFEMEPSFVIIDGNFKSEFVDTFNVTLLVTHDVIADNLVTGDNEIEVWGNVNIKSKLIFSDVVATFLIKNNLIANTIINSIPYKKDLRFVVEGKISGVNRLCIAENSYGQMGNADSLKKLGFDNIETMDSEEWEEIGLL